MIDDIVIVTALSLIVCGIYAVAVWWIERRGRDEDK